jgi:hypothetical protein
MVCIVKHFANHLHFGITTLLLLGIAPSLRAAGLPLKVAVRTLRNPAGPARACGLRFAYPWWLKVSTLLDPLIQ